MNLPILPPVKPMLAKPVKAIPPGMIFEPKWDGFRSIIFRAGDEVEIGSRNERPLTRYFPDLVEQVLAQFPPRTVIDGEIVLIDRDSSQLDFELLQQRIHPAASRVEMLAAKTPAGFVAFDLLAFGDDDLTERPFEQRRLALENALKDAKAPIWVTPATRDADEAKVWFERYEGAGLDGLIAKPPELAYSPDKRVLFKIKHERTCDAIVAGYRTHKNDDEAIGSLLLGLYDEGGQLVSVGVIGAFPAARRKELFVELAPLVTTFDDHPWNWAGEQIARAPGRAAGSRWNSGKDLSFTPLAPERVVEARYDYLEGRRFRHTAQFVRWRPDREPSSCTYEQLEQPVAFDLGEVLPGAT